MATERALLSFERGSRTAFESHIQAGIHCAVFPQFSAMVTVVSSSEATSPYPEQRTIRMLDLVRGLTRADCGASIEPGGRLSGLCPR